MPRRKSGRAVCRQDFTITNYQVIGRYLQTSNWLQLASRLAKKNTSPRPRGPQTEGKKGSRIQQSFLQKCRNLKRRTVGTSGRRSSIRPTYNYLVNQKPYRITALTSVDMTAKAQEPRRKSQGARSQVQEPRRKSPDPIECYASAQFFRSCAATFVLVAHGGGCTVQAKRASPSPPGSPSHPRTHPQ